MNKFIFIAVVGLTGCASSTGIIPAGKDQYMIYREDNGPAASLGAIKAAAFKEASAFCTGQGKSMRVVRENDVPRSFGQFPQTSLTFACA